MKTEVLTQQRGMRAPLFDVYADPPWLLHLSGELDMAGACSLAEALAGPVERGGVVGLDVAGLTFMDSTGINAFVGATRVLGERGRLVMFHPRRAVQRVIEICGLGGTIDIDDERSGVCG